jgi:hypothetical protein
MSNSFVITFLIHHTHLGFSGGCHTIEYRAIAYQNMLIHAQLSGIFGIEMGQKKFLGRRKQMRAKPATS